MCFPTQRGAASTTSCMRHDPALALKPKASPRTMQVLGPVSRTLKKSSTQKSKSKRAATFSGPLQTCLARRVELELVRGLQRTVDQTPTMSLATSSRTCESGVSCWEIALTHSALPGLHQKYLTSDHSGPTWAARPAQPWAISSATYPELSQEVSQATA